VGTYWGMYTHWGSDFAYEQNFYRILNSVIIHILFLSDSDLFSSVLGRGELNVCVCKFYS
jgi:hypothetical protein